MRMTDAIAKFSPVYEPAVITADFEAMEAARDELIKPFLNMDEEMLAKMPLADVKRSRANLRAIIKDVEDARKRVKREYSAPLDAFEARVKDLLAPAREADERMKAAVDSKEAALRDERYRRLSERYEEFAPALVPVVPVDRLIEDRWLTKTGFGEGMQALEEKVEQISSDWEALKAQEATLPFFNEAEAELFRTLDLGAALRLSQSRAEEQARIDALKADVEENLAAARRARERGDHEKADFIERVSEVCERGREASRAEAEEQSGLVEEACPWVMIVPSATRSQMQQLGSYATSLGVRGRLCPGTLMEVVRKSRRI